MRSLSDGLRIIAVVATTITSASCDRTIAAGTFRGMQIGQSKIEVLTALNSRGVRSVMPDIDPEILVRSDAVARLSELEHSVWICLYDHSGVHLAMGFDEKGHLQDLKPSSVTPADAFGIAVLQPRRETIDRIRAAMSRDKNLIAANCLPTARWVDIRNPSAHEIEYLRSYSAWEYEEPNSHSSARLLFSNGRLSLIKYRWRHIDF